MPDGGGASQIIIDENYDIHALFNTGNAWPSSALLNHEMMVYDKNPSLFALDDIIPELLENIPDTDPCSGVSYGDINYDGIVNIVDTIIVVQYILGNNITECVPDVNQDGIVNVSDVVILVDFILN